MVFTAGRKHMTAEDWQDPAARALAMAIDGRQIEDSDGETRATVPVALNAHYEPVEFVLPPDGPSGTPCSPRGHRKNAQAHETKDCCARRPVLLLLHSA